MKPTWMTTDGGYELDRDGELDEILGRFEREVVEPQEEARLARETAKELAWLIWMAGNDHGPEEV